jgi:hypothetical protein
MGGLSKLHVSAFYSGHHQVTITNYKRYTNLQIYKLAYLYSSQNTTKDILAKMGAG